VSRALLDIVSILDMSSRRRGTAAVGLTAWRIRAS
jgi:hypothetical protein